MSNPGKEESRAKPSLARDSSGSIVAIRGERGSYNNVEKGLRRHAIVAIRGERGSYNRQGIVHDADLIVAIRGERGSYNFTERRERERAIVAIRGERGSYNVPSCR